MFSNRTQRPPPPPLSPSHTLSVHTVLWHRVREWRVKPERRLEGQQFTNNWVENTDIIVCISSLCINFDKHLQQSRFIGQFFLDDDILLWCLCSSFVHEKSSTNLWKVFTKNAYKILNVHVTKQFHRAGTTRGGKVAVLRLLQHGLRHCHQGQTKILQWGGVT